MNYQAVSKLVLLLVCSLLLPVSLFASEIQVRPFLLDVELSARDTKQEIITLTNDYPTRKAVLYATVNEITVDTAGEIKEFITPVMTDRTTAITSWIEISRGRIEVMPGESVEIPLTIRVHPYAEPGEYYAFIGMVEASKRGVAESIAMAGDADGVLVKIVIADERKDSMRIANFLIDRFVTSEDNRTVTVDIENMGDLASAPTGEVIFYNSRGVEVGSQPINAAGKQVEPKETISLQSEVPLDVAIGRVKANVSMQYGENQRATLYDTTYFYIIPLHLLLIAFGGILLLSIVITLLLRRALHGDDYNEDGDEVTMYVRDGHDPKPQDHDIDLKNKT